MNQIAVETASAHFPDMFLLVTGSFYIININTTLQCMMSFFKPNWKIPNTEFNALKLALFSYFLILFLTA